jgi:protein-tyrosine phosphatase
MAPSPDWSEIVPNLLVGACPRPRDLIWLHRRCAVTAIVSVQDDVDLASKGLDAQELARACRDCQVAYHRLPVTDGDAPGLVRQIEPVVSLLHSLIGRGERVYLHCNAGMNRAPTLAIAYLHARCGFGLADAREHVKRQRHCVPYMRVLEEYFCGARR